MVLRSVAAFLLCWLVTSQTFGQSKKRKNDGKIQVILLQLNDIYEISPLEQGKIGGAARVATIRNELKKQNPLTYTILAGDFLSPSAMGTLKYNGKTIAGLQMVETLDAIGVDLVTFGNHEFDIDSNALKKAIDTSRFSWISSNVRIKDSTFMRRFQKTKNNNPEPLADTCILRLKDADGTEVKIGMFGLTVRSAGKYETYENYDTAAANAINLLRQKCDFIVAVTHLDIDTDKAIASKFPEIKLIIGGHEHTHSYDTIGNTIIAKADANVKTVYVHALNYDTHTKKLNISSRLVDVNDAIKEDEVTKKVVDKWNDRADSILKSNKFEPCVILDSIARPLDGREATIRTSQTNLGQLIGESMMEAIAEPTDCAIFNSGSIRLDDVLKGYITQYDVFRTLPFESPMVIKELQGTMINALLQTNSNREREGGYLQYAGIEKKDSEYYIKGKVLCNDTAYYKVVMNKYLATGSQPGLEFIKDLQPAANTSPQLIENIGTNDIRKALMEKLKKNSANKQFPGNNKTVPCY